MLWPAAKGARQMGHSSLDLCNSSASCDDSLQEATPSSCRTIAGSAGSISSSRVAAASSTSEMTISMSAAVRPMMRYGGVVTMSFEKRSSMAPCPTLSAPVVHSTLIAVSLPSDSRSRSSSGPPVINQFTYSRNFAMGGIGAAGTAAAPILLAAAREWLTRLGTIGCRVGGRAWAARSHAARSVWTIQYVRWTTMDGWSAHTQATIWTARETCEERLVV